jgi:hypothetical protein
LPKLNIGAKNHRFKRFFASINSGQNQQIVSGMTMNKIIVA